VTWPKAFVISLAEFVFKKILFVFFHMYSKTFTDEKMKIEECVKKGKENCEESHHRAVAAEVSP
jgi:hypothetical protein